MAPLHLDALANSLARVTRRCDKIIVPAGEASKNMQTLTGLLNDILDLGVDRGLVIQPGRCYRRFGGFAAASLMRVDFVQVPTSLLAQVDSSWQDWGQRARGKNLIGAFYQPRAVLADTAALATLLPRELRAAMRKWP